jgi:hypothetical protein
MMSVSHSRPSHEDAFAVDMENDEHVVVLRGGGNLNDPSKCETGPMYQQM